MNPAIHLLHVTAPRVAVAVMGWRTGLSRRAAGMALGPVVRLRAPH